MQTGDRDLFTHNLHRLIVVAVKSLKTIQVFGFNSVHHSIPRVEIHELTFATCFALLFTMQDGVHQATALHLGNEFR